MAQNIDLLVCEPREEAGSRPARRLRRNGRIPCVVYGGAESRLTVTADALELTRAVGHPSILTLKVGDDEKKVLVQEAQWDYLKNQLLHVDFREIRMDQRIQTTVPLVSVGDPVGTSQGGILDQMLFEIEVECLPADLPEQIEMDVSHLDLDDQILITELTPPEGVEIVISDETQMLAHVYMPRIVEEEPAAEEGEEGLEGLEGEGLEGEEGEGAEGAEAAADGDDAAKEE